MQAGADRSDSRTVATARVISIRVVQSGWGWALRAPLLGEDIFFLSGHCAEAAGRSLARRLATAGHAASLEVVLRSGAVVSRLRYPVFRLRNGRR